MRRASLVGLAGALVVASAAGTAFAAPPWSEPRPIGSATGSGSDATIDFGPGGTALLSRSADQNELQTSADRLATLTPEGRLVEHRPLSDRLAAPPQRFGRGRVALLRQRVLFEEAPQRVRLSLSVGSIARPAGRGRPHRLATFTMFPNGGSPAMAAGPQGQIAIVWMTWRGELEAGRFRVRLALRRPNGRFETRTVASGATDQTGVYDPPGVAVAIGARGDVIVAYSAAGQFIRVRTLRHGRRFGRPQVLGPHATAVDLAARASRTGRVVVAWGTQDGGEEFDEPYVVRAAMRAPEAARFGPMQVIDPGELNQQFVPGPVELAMAADGTAALAWSNARGGFADLTHPVRVAVAERNGGFGPAAELSANGTAQDVAVREDGAAVVAWTDAGATFAVLRGGPGQPFGQPELVALSGPAGHVALAYAPRTRRPTAVWIASDRLQLVTRAG